MLPPPRTRVLRTVATPEDVLDLLAERFPVASGDAIPVRTTWADTFDGRLAAAGLTLRADRTRDRQILRLRDAERKTLARVPGAELPQFADDAESSALREHLLPLSGIRRLLPLASRDGHRRGVRILDRETKTVTRLVIETGSLFSAAREGEPVDWPTTVRVREVRGYVDDFDRVCEALEELPDLRLAQGSDLELAAELVGRPPGFRRLEPFRFSFETRAEEAVRGLLAELCTVVRRNEDGVRRDLDTEFLHDLRVAVRRARSLLGQIRGVLPSEEADLLRSELRWLQKETGPLRDLDVHLLKLPETREGLAAEHRPALDPFERWVERHRSEEQERLVGVLDSDRYRALIELWSRSGSGSSSGAGPRADEPIGAVAAERTLRAWKRLRKKGRRIVASTEAAALHRLRIDAKKLRYLLELFGSLWPKDERKSLVKSLKRLQDNLGDFQDFEVQQDKLVEIARGMVEDGDAPVESLLVLGRLAARLEEGQHTERRRFHEIFSGFDSDANRDRFRELLGGRG